MRCVLGLMPMITRIMPQKYIQIHVLQCLFIIDVLGNQNFSALAIQIFEVGFQSVMKQASISFRMSINKANYHVLCLRSLSSTQHSEILTMKTFLTYMWLRTMSIVISKEIVRTNLTNLSLTLYNEKCAFGIIYTRVACFTHVLPRLIPVDVCQLTSDSH